MRRGTRGAGAYRRRDGAVAVEMAILSRFMGPKRDKIVHPDTKSFPRRTFGHRPPGGTVQPDEYIETRVRQYQDSYDRGASSSKSRSVRMRGASVVGGSAGSAKGEDT